MVSFTYYPTSNRVPGVYVEMDNSQANTGGQPPQRTLLIGQVLTAPLGSSGQANQPILCPSVKFAHDFCGRGSVLSMMAERYIKSDPFSTLYLLPIADDPTATPWSNTLTLGGVASYGAGTLSTYIAGIAVPVGVAQGDTAIAVATRLGNAIKANPDMPVNVTGTPPAIILTAKNKGAIGNDIDIRWNYLGINGGEALPPGLTITRGAVTPGTVWPNISLGLANLSSEPFDFIGLQGYEATTVGKMKAFLSDNGGRWSWQSMVYGHCFCAHRNTVGGATSVGLANNDQHLSIIPYNGAPEPLWIWGAETLAACAASLRVDPALPLQYIGTTLMPPPLANRYMINERNTLLYDGMSTWRVAADNTVMIERMVTTYQKNLAGAPDNSYLDVETMYGLMYVARDLTAYLSSRYARKKLVSDQTQIVFGSNTVSAAMIKASVIVEYRALQAAGYVQNAQNFARDVIVENAGNGLIRILAPVDLANQLRQIALLLQFRKS